MSLRVALSLWGQPRFYQQTYDHFFSNIIEMFDTDVYFHTWWSEDMIGTQYPCAPHAKASLSDKDMLVNADIPEKLLDLYKPVNYLIEGYEEVKDWVKESERNQYYSQWASKECINTFYDEVQWNKKYDLVIRSRFDLMCTQDITFLFDDNLWVPSCCPYTDGRVNDMFSISNWNIFDKITDTYLNLEEFSKEGKGEMEWALAKQIEKHNIPTKKFKADYSSFDILRSETAKQFS